MRVWICPVSSSAAAAVDVNWNPCASVCVCVKDVSESERTVDVMALLVSFTVRYAHNTEYVKRETQQRKNVRKTKRIWKIKKKFKRIDESVNETTWVSSPCKRSNDLDTFRVYTNTPNLVWMKRKASEKYSTSVVNEWKEEDKKKPLAEAYELNIAYNFLTPSL